VRVSSLEQHEVRQLEALVMDKTFTDKASGKDADRPQLNSIKGVRRVSRHRTLNVSTCRRRHHRAPPGGNFCQYLYSLRSRSLIVASPIPLVSLLMGGTMVFLKSG
jgi:hypothetical protein